MILDQQLLLDTASAITVTAVSANVVDFNQLRDMGVGDRALDLVIMTVAAFTAAGAATLTIEVQTSTDNVTYTVLAVSPAFAIADLGANKEIFKMKVPAGIKRYLRLNRAVATGPFTAGSLTAAIVLDRQASDTYAAGAVVVN